METYEAGESVSKYINNARLDEVNEDSHMNKALADLGLRILLKMLLSDNFLHADLHPGNIHVRMEERAAGWWASLTGAREKVLRPTLVLLDCGMATELSERNQVNLVDFFRAVVSGDGQQVAKSMLTFSAEQRCKTPEEFIDAVAPTFRTAYERAMDLTDSLHEVLEKVRQHRVNVAGEVSSVIVTTMVLEGWSAQLDPDLDIINVMREILSASEKVSRFQRFLGLRPTSAGHPPPLPPPPPPEPLEPRLAA